jgi:hypothetical protein
MLSKFDLLMLAAATAAAVVWIEHEHRVVIDPPDSPELTSPVLASLVPATSCADDEDARYGVNRLAFLEAGFLSGSVGRPSIPPRRSPNCETN